MKQRLLHVCLVLAGVVIGILSTAMFEQFSTNGTLGRDVSRQEEVPEFAFREKLKNVNPAAISIVPFVNGTDVHARPLYIKDAEHVYLLDCGAGQSEEVCYTPSVIPDADPNSIQLITTQREFPNFLKDSQHVFCYDEKTIFNPKTFDPAPYVNPHINYVQIKMSPCVLFR